jgi:hypothetical protein
MMKVFEWEDGKWNSIDSERSQALSKVMILRFRKFPSFSTKEMDILRTRFHLNQEQYS